MARRPEQPLDAYLYEQFGRAAEALDNIDTAIKGIRDDAGEREDRITARIDSLQAEVREARTKMDGMQTEVASLTRQVAGMQGPVDFVVSVRQWAASMAGVLALASSLVWYFWKPISERFLAAWGKF